MASRILYEFLSSRAAESDSASGPLVYRFIPIHLFPVLFQHRVPYIMNTLLLGEFCPDMTLALD